MAYTYCVAFGDLEPDLAEVVRILDGEPRQGDLDLATLQGSAALLWTEEVARRGPDRIDRQSVVVAKAVREALRSDDAAGLRRPAVAEAVEQITPVARNACEGHGLRGR